MATKEQQIWTSTHQHPDSETAIWVLGFGAGDALLSTCYNHYIISKLNPFYRQNFQAKVS
jgi:hypothetical protein